MTTRLEIQALLESLLGSRNVYFQPPPTIQMSYPCIVYKRKRERKQYASNHPYFRKKGYDVTVIDGNPDSEIPDKVGDLPMSSFSTHFATKNLNHDVYSVYF